MKIGSSVTKTMTFVEYQSDCPFAKFGLKDGYLSEFELTCRRKDNIPAGHSWGVCDEEHCPEFGVKIEMRDIVVRNAEIGEIIAVAESGTCRACKNGEE